MVIDVRLTPVTLPIRKRLPAWPGPAPCPPPGSAPPPGTAPPPGSAPFPPDWPGLSENGPFEPLAPEPAAPEPVALGAERSCTTAAAIPPPAAAAATMITARTAGRIRRFRGAVPGQPDGTGGAPAAPGGLPSPAPSRAPSPAGLLEPLSPSSSGQRSSGQSPPAWPAGPAGRSPPAWPAGPAGRSPPAWPAGSEDRCDMGCVPALPCSVDEVRIPGCCGGGCTAVTPVLSAGGAEHPHAPRARV